MRKNLGGRADSGGGAAALVRSKSKHSLCERGGPARPGFTPTHS